MQNDQTPTEGNHSANHETEAALDGATCSPVFSVDHGLIRKVMESIEHIGDDSDSDCACRRVYCRMLAEATGMPLAGHRLLMEKELQPKYRKDYSLAPIFQENSRVSIAPHQKNP